MGRGRGQTARSAGAKGTGTARRGPTPAVKRGPYKWTEQRIESALRQMVASDGRIPSTTELDRRGLSGLRTAISSYGGLPYWARRLGVGLAPGQNRTPISEDDFRRELAEVLAEHGPIGTKTLRRLGHDRLASYVQRRGGTKAVARQFGLQLPR